MRIKNTINILHLFIKKNKKRSLMHEMLFFFGSIKNANLIIILYVQMIILMQFKALKISKSKHKICIKVNFNQN